MCQSNKIQRPPTFRIEISLNIRSDMDRSLHHALMLSFINSTHAKLQALSLIRAAFPSEKKKGGNGEYWREIRFFGVNRNFQFVLGHENDSISLLVHTSTALGYNCEGL